jgi:hypothetical protein
MPNPGQAGGLERRWVAGCPWELGRGPVPSHGVSRGMVLGREEGERNDAAA